MAQLGKLTGKPRVGHVPSQVADKPESRADDRSRCDACGLVFTPRKSHQRWCSSSCGARAVAKRVRVGRPKAR